MRRLAIITAETFINPRGQAIAEMNRIIHLQAIADYQIDVFSFCEYEGWLVRKLRHSTKIERKEYKIINNITIRFKWRRFSLIDYILTVKLHLRPIINNGWTLKYASSFRCYDLIVANSFEGGEIALEILKKYGIPYCAIWHGSDIHTIPFLNNYWFETTKIILDNAKVNFMVSKKLLEISEGISQIENKMVLYNGINSSFYKYDTAKRLELKNKYGACGKKIVAFAGNLFAVKNPLSLPDIFNFSYRLNNNIVFWVIGTGKMEEQVKQKCNEYQLPITFWGDVPSERMPDFYNCIDVLVLPSINEGLPLVTVEAIACGANVVGSRSGGIPEVIGAENSFDRNDENFTLNVATRIDYMLTHTVIQNLGTKFSWSASAKIENRVYHKIFSGSI